MKDNFSIQSDDYARYRPTYPDALFDFINSVCKNKNHAWDCGTGNGQIAIELSKQFEHVFATDISIEQIKNAQQANNITYSIQASESTNFNQNFFDLIIVAQAVHWFDFDNFYAEVRRTSKDNAIICLVGYNRVKVSTEIDAIISEFYHHIIGKYWDEERKYIDENYTNIPFPFKEIEVPELKNILDWNFEHFIGYLNTWSSVKHFIRANKFNPVDMLKEELNQYWKENEIKQVQFPIFMRIGYVV